MAKNPINNTIEFTRNHLGRTVADTIAHSLHREYLNAVLPGLENFPANRVRELTPAAWFARK